MKEIIKIQDLTIGYNDKIILKDLNFNINESDIFIIMGGSGCGKTTLLKTLIGLNSIISGNVFIDSINLSNINNNQKDKEKFVKNIGVLYQNSALWTSMTLAENISLPLQKWTNYSKNTIDDIVSFKLSLVGLSGFEDYYPYQISGGMKKRVALARALALDPKILFLDEPSAGLDPITSKHLDELIIEINKNLGTTIVIITHELYSIFSIASNSIFIDKDLKTITAIGNPKELLKNKKNKNLYQFLTRGNV